MEKNIQFKKNFIWNTLGSGFNAFNSLFFMIIVTRINGVNDAGIFAIAFSTACILYSVGIYAGRIYQVTELNKKITDKDFIVSRLITSISMLILLLIFCIYKRYDITKILVFLLLTLFKALDAFSDVLHGILQKNDKLEIVGKSLFIKSILAILSFILIDIFTKDMLISIISINIISILIIIFYDFKKASTYIDFKVKAKKENIINILKKGFFIFTISFLSMYVLNAPKYAIDTYLTNDYQTIFGIIVMPATIIGLVSQFLIHPYLNKILEFYENRNLKELKKLLLKINMLVVGIGAISTILGYLIGTQILGIVYGLNLSSYKIALAIIIISATLYTIGTVYSSILTTVRKTFVQFIIYVLVAIIAYILSGIFTRKYGIKGAIIAYFMIMVCQSFMYFVYTKINIEKIFKCEVNK